MGRAASTVQPPERSPVPSRQSLGSRHRRLIPGQRRRPSKSNCAAWRCPRHRGAWQEITRRSAAVPASSRCSLMARSCAARQPSFPYEQRRHYLLSRQPCSAAALLQCPCGTALDPEGRLTAPVARGSLPGPSVTGTGPVVGLAPDQLAVGRVVWSVIPVSGGLCCSFPRQSPTTSGISSRSALNDSTERSPAQSGLKRKQQPCPSKEIPATTCTSLAFIDQPPIRTVRHASTRRRGLSTVPRGRRPCALGGR